MKLAMDQYDKDGVVPKRYKSHVVRDVYELAYITARFGGRIPKNVHVPKVDVHARYDWGLTLEGLKE